jgi:4-amino-4-deoxy-L-arabinose transferase-like glycosyltransferase
MPRRLRTIATSLPLILIVATILRLGFFWDYVGQNPHRALGVLPFLFEPGNIAASIVSGAGYSSPFRVASGPTAWMAPVYPLLLAGVFRIFGAYTFHSFIAATLLNILFSVLTCIPIFRIGRRVGGLGVAAGAAWLWAVFPNAILVPFECMWDASLAALLAAGILWATIELADSLRLRDWTAYGALWGFALMTNPTLLGLLPFLLGWIFWRGRSRASDLLKPAGVALGVMVLCCVPWTIRNYLAFDTFVPLRANLGVQLWCGNNESARDLWLGEGHPIHDSIERAHYIEIGEIAYEREKRAEALNYMATHPRRELHLTWVRFKTFWSGGTPSPVADFIRSRSKWFRYVVFFNLLTAVGALGGIIVLLVRRNAYAFPLAVFPLIFPWAYYLTIVEPRYRQPVDPVAMLLTAITVAQLFRGRRTGDDGSSR